jgi:hypothetical protein
VHTKLDALGAEGAPDVRYVVVGTAVPGTTGENERGG